MSGVIKIVFNGEVRRITVGEKGGPKPLKLNGESVMKFSDLVDIIHRSYPALGGKTPSVRYEDDEGDEVTISSDEELLEALRILKKAGIKIPKFMVLPASDDLSASEVSDKCGELKVHSLVTCDECGMSPIVGARYKCTTRHDFDLCEKCEAVRVQPFPMLKITDPDQHRADRFGRGRGIGRIFGPGGCSQGGRGGVRGMTGSFGVAGGGGRGAQHRMRAYGPMNGFHAHGNHGGSHTPPPGLTPAYTGGFPVAASAPASTQGSSSDGGAAFERSSFISAMDSEAWVRGLEVKDYKEEKEIEESLLQEVIQESLHNSSTAVGQVPSKPALRFVRDVTFPDGAAVPPNAVVRKVWRVRNDGKARWPEDAVLANAGGDEVTVPGLKVGVPILDAGEEADISVEVTSPEAPGRYVSYFRMQTKDEKYFGQRLWVDILVASEAVESEWQVVRAQQEKGVTLASSATALVPPTAAGAGADVAGKDTDNACMQVPPVVSVDSSTASSATSALIPALQVPPPLSPPVPPAPMPVLPDVAPIRWEKELQLLHEMGFTDRDAVVPLLETHLGSSSGAPTPGEGLQRVVAVLLSGAGVLR